MWTIDVCACGDLDDDLAGAGDDEFDLELWGDLDPSFWALILNQVSPSALAKWSSTEFGDMSMLDGSFCDLIWFHVSPPNARAKWSSTDPAEQARK